MYVCICHGVTDHDIRRAAADGVGSLTELTMRTGVASNCGSCADLAREILAESKPARALGLPVLQAA